MAAMSDWAGMSPIEAITQAIKDKMGLLSDKDRQQLRDNMEQAMKENPVPDGAYYIDGENPPNQWTTLLDAAAGAGNGNFLVYLLVGILFLLIIKD